KRDTPSSALSEPARSAFGLARTQRRRTAIRSSPGCSGPASGRGAAPRRRPTSRRSTAGRRRSSTRLSGAPPIALEEEDDRRRNVDRRVGSDEEPDQEGKSEAVDDGTA